MRNERLLKKRSEKYGMHRKRGEIEIEVYWELRMTIKIDWRE
jgi:hypothetical protein